MSSSGISQSNREEGHDEKNSHRKTQQTTVVGAENFLLPDDNQSAAALTAIGPPATETAAASIPEVISRYRVQRVLGDGGFGRVFLCRDEVLNRLVAVKVPHASRITRQEDIEEYVAEAKILASFDHRNIVPVYDCGHSNDGLCFIVSKYIDGSDLASRLKHTPPSFAASADLLSRICDALHYAHQRHIIHRDVKPANILIDREEQPWLTDFGIALTKKIMVAFSRRWAHCPT